MKLPSFSFYRTGTWAALAFLILFSGKCDKGIYEQPCGAPCKYGDRLIYVQTHGVKDPDRLDLILDSLGLRRRSDFNVEARYLRAPQLGLKWLGERKVEMSLSEYNKRLNADLELFTRERNYFYREVLYSEKALDGERKTLHKLRKALHIDLGEEGEVIGYVADLCSAYESGCEKAYPSIIPNHKFGIEVNAPEATRWNRDSVIEHFPFLEDYDVSFYGEGENGQARFYTDEKEGTVSFGIDLKKLSCIEIQELAFRLGSHRDIRGMKGGSALEMATPIGCSEKEVERRERPDL